MSRMKRFLLMLGVATIIATSTGCAGTPTSGMKASVSIHSEQDYKDFIADTMNDQSTSFEALTYLFNNPKMGNDAWTKDVAMVLAGLQMSSMDYLNYTDIPSGYEQIDKHLDKAMNSYIDFTTTTAEGIDARDSDIIRKANGYLAAGVKEVDAATQLMKTK